MSLPEPEFIMRDPDIITKELISTFERITGRLLYPAQVERILIDLIAYREALIRIGIQFAAKQNLVAFANYPMLDYLGELVGVKRLNPQKAVATLRFTLETDPGLNVLIPEGIRVQTQDGRFIFETTENKVIETGGNLFVDVLARCTTEGTSANNYITGAVNKLLDPIAYISMVENITISSGGSNRELDDELRERIRLAPEAFSNAGSKGAYIYWTKTVNPNIIDVAVISPSPGVVNIYPLMVDGNPTSTMLTEIYYFLSQDKIRPLTDQVNVLSPIKIDYVIFANITLYNNADIGTIQNEVNKKLSEYIKKQKSKLGLDLVPSQIIAIINSIYGVYKVDLVNPQYKELVENEWANCTNQTVNYVGYANG